MTWQEVLEDKSLQDLPYRIELNNLGQIVMTRINVRHSRRMAEIQFGLQDALHGGHTFPICAVQTSDNVKVVDVVWFSSERYEQVKDEDACSVAPEICVEVLSESNTEEEMRHKRALYFEKSAIECWLYDNDGNMSFYTATEKIEKSSLVPGFPSKINI